MITPDPGSAGTPSGAPSRPRSFAQVTRPPVRVYLVGGALLVLAVTLIALAVPVTTPASAAWLGLASLFLAAGGLLALSSIRFRFDDTAVHIALVPVFRTSIRLDEVAAVDVVEYLTVEDARGRGVRRRTDRGRTLLYDAGPAIRLTTTDGRRFVVRSRYPGEAARALSEALR